MQTTYFSFLRQVLIQFGSNIASFFQGTGNLALDFENYHRTYLEYSAGFGVGGWIFYVLIILLAFGVAGSSITFFASSLRRLFLRTSPKKKGVVRQEDEVQALRLELCQAESERRRLMGVPSSTSSFAASLPSNIRFPRLRAIDEEGKDIMEQTSEGKESTLREFCANFRMYAAHSLGLYYSKEDIFCFVSSLAASHILLLEGISGTGKTSLPYAFGQYIQSPVTICPVQPSWRERTDILGYFNEFTGKFTETDFLIALYRARKTNRPVLIVLDEVNLAHIEYYFADFLSLLETPSKEAKYIPIIAQPMEGDPSELEQGKLPLGENVFFIGTANNDDSTFAISSKVYDRSMVLPLEQRADAFESRETSARQISAKELNSLFLEARKEHPVSDAVLVGLNVLTQALREDLSTSFGNRILRQLNEFLPAYVACGGEEMAGFDYFFSTKILKKIENSSARENLNGLYKLKETIVSLYGSDSFPRTRKRIDGLIGRDEVC